VLLYFLDNKNAQQFVRIIFVIDYMYHEFVKKLADQFGTSKYSFLKVFTWLFLAKGNGIVLFWWNSSSAQVVIRSKVQAIFDLLLNLYFFFCSNTRGYQLVLDWQEWFSLDRQIPWYMTPSTLSLHPSIIWQHHPLGHRFQWNQLPHYR
jgi:hypothetical protein